MTSKAVIIAVIAVVAVVAVAGAVLLTGGSEKHEDPQAITDCAGNQIHFTEIPERIVSMDAKSTEMLCEVGLLDHIVGVQSDDGVFDVTNFIYGIDFDINYPDELKKKIASGEIKKVGKTSSWTFEQVMSVNPDLVVFNKSDNNLKTMQQLQEAGVTCFVLHANADFTTLETVYDNMDLVGKAFGKTSITDKFNEQMRDTISKIYDKCKTYKGKDVAFLAYSSGKLYVYGGGNFKVTTAKEMGCTSKMLPDKSYAVITVENVLEFQPDVIIMSGGGANDNISEIRDELYKDPLWSEVNAVKNNQIYFIEYNANQSLGYWTHHYIHGVALMSTIIFDEMAIDVPEIVKSSEYLNYIKWVEDL